FSLSLFSHSDRKRDISKSEGIKYLESPCLSFKARPSNHHVLSVPSPSPSLFPPNPPFCPQQPHAPQSVIISIGKKEKDQTEREGSETWTCVCKRRSSGRHPSFLCWAFFLVLSEGSAPFKTFKSLLLGNQASWSDYLLHQAN
ncbi:hypothetical protein F2P56_021334, partial [Juglans regia]